MIGEKVRSLREQHQLLLRQLAAKLDMDAAMLSKMERGDRSFKKEDVVNLARIFKQPERDLLALWLADKILKATENEEYSDQALKLALQQVQKNQNSTTN